MLGTQGLSGYKKLFFGSVTESALRRTPVPVLVTPALEPAGSEGYLCEGGVVLAPVDFSDHCATDVAAAAEFAQRTDASLLLLHVVPHPQGPALLQRYLEDRHRLIHAEAVSMMTHLVAHLDTAVPVERLA